MPRWQRPIAGEPAEPGSVGNGHRSKVEKAISLQLAAQRVRWQRLKNEEAARKLKAQTERLVDFEEFKRQILAANAIVKHTVLAMIEREDLPHDIRVRLKHKLIEVLNELAFEQQYKGE